MKTQKFDASDYLATPEDVAAYIEAALEYYDPKLLLVALCDVINIRELVIKGYMRRGLLNVRV